MSKLTAIGFWADHRHPGWPDPRESIAGDLDVGEREEVASYLERGTVVQVCRGWSHCRVCGFDQNGCADLSDGTYLWPEGLAHYVHLAWRQALRRAMAGRPHCERCGGLSTLLVYRHAEGIFAQDLAEGGATLTLEQGPPGVDAQRPCLGCGHTWR